MTTMTHQSYEPSIAIRGVPRSNPLRRLREMIANLLCVYDRRQQRLALLDLDARLLEDIGKSRGQAVTEGSKSFWR